MAKKSIHTLLPDLSGRYARQGFVYQDHVGVYLCLKMLENDHISEIWFETQDDITIIWNEGGQDAVEFVQVKNEDRSSRWSVSALCYKKDGKGCVLTKSLNNDRCKEAVRFRMVTSYDVDNELSLLKYPLNSTFRKGNQNKEKELIKGLQKSLGPFKSPNGNGIDYWTKNCFWEKLSDSIEALQAENKLLLENALKRLPKVLYSDQRDELYQRFLGLVKNASTVDVFTDLGLAKIKKTSLANWIERTVEDFGAPKGGTEKLLHKLKEAEIDTAIIKNAEILKWQYLAAKLNIDFVKAKEYSKLERKISEILLDLKLKLDSGLLSLDGVGFLLHCKTKVEEYADNNLSIPKDEAVGFMFEHTNKCLHRFIKPNK